MEIVGCITFLSLVTLAIAFPPPGGQQVPAFKPAVAQGFSLPGASAASSSFSSAQSAPSFGTFGFPTAFQQKAPGSLFAPTKPLSGDSLSTFASSFSQAVSQSNALNGLFNSITGIPITTDLYYNDMISLMQTLGIANPTALGQSVVNAISSVSGIVTPQSYISSVANSVGRFLTNQGLLNPLNAASLSRQYADALVTTVNSRGPNLTPQSYVSALALGTINFLRPFNVVSTASAEALANTFVQQLNTLRLN